MRGRHKPSAWQVSVVDIASGRALALAPERPQELALKPVAWSGATDEIILHAVIPFQPDGAAGAWAARADGSGLRRLLPEPDFVGEPRLSPDGHLMAFLGSDPDKLPDTYVASPGEPPANTLRVLDLTTGETRTLTLRPAHAFDQPAWDAAGETLFFRQGTWQGIERGFLFTEVVSLRVNRSTAETVLRAPQGILGFQPCPDGGLAYATPRGRGASVRWDRSDAVGRTEWVVEEGTVEILVCR
jgi:hypothetical protein